MDYSLIGLIISTITILGLFTYLISMKPKKQLTYIFFLNSVCILIWNFGLIGQILFAKKYNVNSIYFDYFTYIGICFLPVFMFFTSLIFANTKIVFKKKYLPLFIVPIISLLLLWTNDFHHLFYIKYSVNLDETIFGKYFNIHSIYTYLLYFVSLFNLLRYSIKNSGFFSKQAILIIIAVMPPVIVNVLIFLNIIKANIYLTPIYFSVTVLLLAAAILKFGFLSITPIALQRIVDRISDSYIVINDKGAITDFNQTFLNTFNLRSSNVRNKHFLDLIANYQINTDELKYTLNKARTSTETFTFEKYFENLDKYFHIEINSITNNGDFLGILILFKDITQHIEDMDTIKSNQDLLMEKERLASLGQLIGGIAHNLKTPIMSISGATEGLTDLIKEYTASIDNPVVTAQDHYDIARDMQEWVEKIKTHSSYMSDVITAVKGQAVTLSEQDVDTFTIEELVKRVNILMKHELKNALIDLNMHIETDSSLVLKGNVNSLVQVINNMISNAIQAYEGQTNKSIDMFVHVKDKNVRISIQDYGMGMTKEVQNKLFKEMITTKGKNGTGLGLFMSYSTIRAHFNGNITFNSEVGKGTTFNIVLPL